MCRLIGPHWACTHPCPTTHSRVLSHRRQRASTAKQSSRWCWAVGACSPLLLTLDNLHFGRARLTGCRVYLCGRGRCVLAALLEPVACRSGGYHGMAVWPDPGRLDVARWSASALTVFLVFARSPGLKANFERPFGSPRLYTVMLSERARLPRPP